MKFISRYRGAKHPAPIFFAGQRKILLFLFSVFVRLLCAQQPGYRIRHLTVKDGLSQNLVRTMILDQTGFLWCGTNDGLNRYDGYQFHVYRYRPDDSTSLADNTIITLENDPDGGFWIGTKQGGLDYYDPQKDRFYHYGYPEIAAGTVISPAIQAIAVDYGTNIWVGTVQGLWRLSRNDRSWESIPLDGIHKSTGLIINSLWLDSAGILWIGTEAGLYRRNQSTGNVKRIDLSISGERRPFPTAVRSLFRDNLGTLWVGTHDGLYQMKLQDADLIPFHLPVDEGELEVLSITESGPSILWFGTARHGIYRLDTNKGELTRIPRDILIQNGLRPSGIHALVVDHDNLLWMGTRGMGLQVLNTQQLFRYYPHIQGDDYSLSSSTVRGIFLSQDSVLWVGGYAGLDGFDRKTGTAVHYRYTPGKKGGLISENIYSIVEDEEGFLWLGTEGQGLLRLNPDNDDVRSFFGSQKDSAGRTVGFFYQIYLDTEGNLWFGTEKGVLRLKKENRDTGTFEQIPTDDAGTFTPNVRAITQDYYGNIWIGTETSGLGIYNPTTNRFRWIRHSQKQPRSLSDNRILCLLPTTSGVLWIGTSGGGLNRMNYADFNVREPQKTEFVHYGVQQGLANEVVYGILSDEEGFLWLSTNAGIWRMNPATEEFWNFPLLAGQQSLEFNRGAWHKGWNGEIFFGGIEGLNSFFPSRVRLPDQAPPIAVTEWQRLTKAAISRQPVSSVVPRKSFFYPPQELDIQYDELSLMVKYAALSFIEPSANRYRYRILGLFDEWVDLPADKRDITLTHLPQGRYQMETQGSNAYGVWNQTARTVILQMHPAPWNSWWAYLIYVATFGIVVVTFIRIRLAQARKRTAELEREVLERTSEIRAREENLRDQNLFLESILESLSYPFYVVDISSYKLVMANTAAREWGRTDADTCYALKPGLDKPCGGESCPLRNVDQYREHRVKREMVKNPSGVEQHIEIHSHPVFNSSGEIKQIIEYYIDVTDRIHLEMNLKKNLEARNRELTSQALKMARDHQVVMNVVNQLQRLDKQSTGQSTSLIRSIESSLKSLVSPGNEWNEFETWFREVHKDFFKRLMDLVPDLTAREQKICAFLKLKLNTKEIASLTNLSVKTVEVYRSRLRNRLNIPAGENLVQFINNI